jgi:hypothetical protein
MGNNEQIRTLDTQLLRVKKALEYLYHGEHCDDYAVNTITDEVQALYAIACGQGTPKPMTPIESPESDVEEALRRI